MPDSSPKEAAPGHSVAAYARRCANMRRNLRHLQRAHESTRWALAITNGINEQMRGEIDATRKERDDWMKISRESKRLDGWGFWLMLFGAFAFGIFVAGAIHG